MTGPMQPITQLQKIAGLTRAAQTMYCRGCSKNETGAISLPMLLLLFLLLADFPNGCVYVTGGVLLARPPARLFPFAAPIPPDPAEP